jgi:hypothetical protein
MYWTYWASDMVRRANLDGTQIEAVVATGGILLQDVALDPAARKIYWTRFCCADDLIQRADADGSNVETLAGEEVGVPTGVALDPAGGRVYWADWYTGGVKTSALDGSDRAELIEFVGWRTWGIALDPGAGKVYWGLWNYSHGEGKIVRANLDGSEVEDVVPGLDRPTGIAIELPGIPVEVPLDIRPGACPNPVNVRSRGKVPIAIVGTDSLDVTEIDTTSLVLRRADGVGGTVLPIVKRSGRIGSIEDVATPFEGELCDCHELGGDGIDDLVIRFSTRQVARTLQLDGANRGDAIELTVSGYLSDGREFTASDCITIVGRPGGMALRNRGGRR